MISYLKSWYQKKFGSADHMVFFLFIFIAVVCVIFLGDILTPLFASIIIAYLLEPLVTYLEKKFKMRRNYAVYIVFAIFIGIIACLVFFLVPIIFNQISLFIKNIPEQIVSLRESVYSFSQNHSNIVSTGQAHDFINAISNIRYEKIADIGQYLLKFSFASMPAVIIMFVYLFLIPLMVFYCLKDKNILISWFIKLLPQNKKSLNYVWQDLKPQLGSYVKGKSIEFLIIATASYLSFALFGLNYAVLLALAVGLSVILPYVGMIIVTFPVVLVALAQYGFGYDFFTVVAIYFIVQTLDGNLLSPLLLSETVKIHPIAILVAVLVFGGIWGLWGMFFAIPLASLIKSSLKMLSEQNIK